MSDEEFLEALPLALGGARNVLGRLSRHRYWEDIRQEVALRLWESGSTRHAGTKGRNAAVEWIRSRKGRTGRKIDPIPMSQLREGFRVECEQRHDDSGLIMREVLGALAMLPRRDAYILEQWALQGQLMKDIGDWVGLTESSVSIRVSKSLRKISRRRKDREARVRARR